MLTHADTTALRSVAFQCRGNEGVVQLALTSGSEPGLLAHITAPDLRGIRILVLVRGVTAMPRSERPPPLPPPPPPPPQSEPPAPAPGPPSAPPATTLPQFPWPPPSWTARTVLPRWMASPGEPLGGVFDRLVSALRRADIVEYSVFAVGTDGFAVVSRLERIADDGRPAPERWSVQPAKRRSFSLRDYLSALFRAEPGRYRVIVFVTTARAVSASAEVPDRETMERLLRSGAGASLR